MSALTTLEMDLDCFFYLFKRKKETIRSVKNLFPFFVFFHLFLDDKGAYLRTRVSRKGYALSSSENTNAERKDARCVQFAIKRAHKEEKGARVPSRSYSERFVNIWCISRARARQKKCYTFSTMMFIISHRHPPLIAKKKKKKKKKDNKDQKVKKKK
jgi:hypothetical protein